MKTNITEERNGFKKLVSFQPSNLIEEENVNLLLAIEKKISNHPDTIDHFKTILNGSDPRGSLNP